MFSGNHQKPGAKVRHSGAEEGGERGRDGGRRQRDQERHLCLQVRDDRDHASLGDEHSERVGSFRLGNSVYEEYCQAPDSWNQGIPCL